MSLLRLAPPLAAPLFRPNTLTLNAHHAPLYFKNLHKTPRIITTASSLPSPTPPLSPPAADLLLDRDWSFIDSTEPDRSDRSIESAQLGPDSKVLVSFGSVQFVDRLVGSNRAVAAVHESLLELALIKEKHDAVRCWHGGVDAVPEPLGPFDAVFVRYFPGMGVSAHGLLRSLAARCVPGARVVISYDEGREVIERHHRQQYPDMVTFDLPDRVTLEKAAADHSFEITEFTDEPTFYLAVLKFAKLKTEI